ncbi:MAG: hypothetical protein FJ030_05640 [Chloroflexi bacterium]|nr:hypothetical protein [Chloroflexota bacterium]
MSPSEILRLAITFVTTLLASVGGVSVIILGLATWLGKIWSDKIYIHTSAKYEKEIEDLKNRYSADLEYLRAEISERRDLLSSTQNALSSGYASSHERILESIEVLWRTIVETRDFTSSFHLIYNILSPHHYENIPVSKLENVLPNMTDEKFGERVKSLQKDIQNKRPFVGEQLWGLYRIYFAFALRLAWKIIKERQQGKVYTWDVDIDGRRDSHLLDSLQGAFTDDELSSIVEKDRACGVPQRVMDALELKMLNEMNELIFGKRLVSMSIEQQQRVTHLLYSIDRAGEKPMD